MLIKRMKRIIPVLPALPSVAGLFVFYIFPSFAAAMYAFTADTYSRKFVGLGNIRYVLESGYFRIAIKNTLLFSVTSVPLTIVSALAIASLTVMFGMKMPLLRKLYFLPVMLPSAAAALAAENLITWLSPAASLMTIFLWKYTGINIIIILTAMSMIDGDTLDAASLDGASSWQKLIYIIIPGSAPSIAFASVLTLSYSLKIFRESYILWGSYPDSSVYMLQNYINNQFGKMNYGYVAACSLIFSVIIYPVIFVILKAEHRINNGEK